MNFKVCLTYALFVSPTIARANVLGIFPGGSSAKSAAMESAVDTRDPQALLYNPAALSLSPPGLDGEFGLGRLEYSYEHPRFDPVQMSVWTPVVSAGWRNETVGPLSWGVAILPTSHAKVQVDGLPRRVDGKTEALTVITARKQFHLPVGGAWTFFKDQTSETSVGLSIIGTYDERKLEAVSIADGTKLIDLTARGTFFRPILGFIQTCDKVNLGVSYMSALTKHYRGSTSFASEPVPFDTEQVDYDPAVLAGGLRFSSGQFSSSLNVNRIFAANGATVNRDGINRKATRSDVRDVNHIGVRFGYLISTEDSVAAAYAYLPSTWGSGNYSVDKDGFSSQEIGHVFGAFNAMPVRNQSLVWRHQVDNLTYQTSLFRSSGRHTVGGGGDNPGYYQIEFVSLTTGLSTTF